MAPARQDVRGAEALEQATEQLKGDVWVLFVGGSAARGFWEGESRAAVEAVEAAAREALDDSATLIVCDVGDRGDWEAARPVHPLRAKAELALRQLPTLLDLNDPRQRLVAQDCHNRDRLRRLLNDE